MKTQLKLARALGLAVALSAVSFSITHAQVLEHVVNGCSATEHEIKPIKPKDEGPTQTICPHDPGNP